MSSPNPESNHPPSKDLLALFREAYNNLEILPLLEQEDLDNFRVDYGGEALEELEQLVEDSPNGDGKIVFAGHRGCGKSTLLAEFSRQMRDRYFVVFFSISDMIEMSDVNHINILFAIAVKLMEEAENQQVKIKSSLKNSFYKWFAKRTRTETEELGAEVSAGFDLFKIIAGKLKTEAKIRDEIKQEFIRNVSDLVATINEIAAVIEASTKNRQVLVIIDDLDKLDLAVAKEIYQSHIKALFQPNFRIILTVPISALRDVGLAATIQTETNNQIVQMPVSKLFKKGERRETAKPQPKPLATLQEVLAKRINSELVEPDTAERIIIYSGGVLREVIRIANECCRICLRLVRRNSEDSNIKINNKVLAEALNKFRIDFDTRIGNADYEILESTYMDSKPNDPNDQRFRDLLHGLYILEYRNAKLWYDVHPIVADLLKER
jgi:GTPase SAR1 family protein